MCTYWHFNHEMFVFWDSYLISFRAFGSLLTTRSRLSLQNTKEMSKCLIVHAFLLTHLSMEVIKF